MLGFTNVDDAGQAILCMLLLFAGALLPLAAGFLAAAVVKLRGK